MVLWWSDDGDALLCSPLLHSDILRKHTNRNDAEQRNDGEVKEREKSKLYFVFSMVKQKEWTGIRIYRRIIIRWDSDSNCKPVNTGHTECRVWTIFLASLFHLFDISSSFIFWTVHDSFFLIFCEYNSFSHPLTLSHSFCVCVPSSLAYSLFVCAKRFVTHFIYFFVCVLSSNKKMQSNWMKKREAAETAMATAIILLKLHR